jgi:hypothetical protein
MVQDKRRHIRILAGFFGKKSKSPRPNDRGPF